MNRRTFVALAASLGIVLPGCEIPTVEISTKCTCGCKTCGQCCSCNPCCRRCKHCKRKRGKFAEVNLGEAEAGPEAQSKYRLRGAIIHIVTKSDHAKRHEIIERLSNDDQAYTKVEAAV